MEPPPLPPRPCRREALAAAGLGAVSLALAACGFDGDEEEELPPLDEDAGAGTELEMLIELAALERRAALTYETGARFSTPRQAREFSVLANQAEAHAGALDSMIELAGDEDPPTEPAPAITFMRDGRTAVLESQRTARRLVAAYLDAIPFQSTGERRRTLTTMLAANAQHEIALGGLPAAQALPGSTEEERQGAGAGGAEDG